MLTSLKSETGHFQAQPVYVEARDTMDKHKPKGDFSGNLESDKMKNHLALKELKPPSSNGCYREKKNQNQWLLKVGYPILSQYYKKDLFFIQNGASWSLRTSQLTPT